MSHWQSRNDAFWSVVTQLLVAVVLFPLVCAFWGKQAAGSFGVGAVICVVPNMYLYWRVFRHFGARAVKRIVGAFYFGEIVKWVLTIIGFMGALQLLWVLPLWLFVGYITTQLGFWLGPLIR